MVDPETRILLRAAAAVAGATAARPAPQSVRLDPAASERLVERALQEGMAGFLRQGFKRAAGEEALAENARQQLEAAYYATVASNLRNLEALADIGAKLKAAGIEAAVIQGAALLIRHYADPGLRPLSDIDLWVLPADREGAAAVLARMGFQSPGLYPNLFRRRAILVDLHTHPLGAERIHARRRLLNAEPEEIFRACARVSWEGAEVRCLGGADEVILLAIHAVKHNFERLVWLADILVVAARWKDREWAAFDQRAQALGQPRLPALVREALKTAFGFRPGEAGRAAAACSPLAACLLRRRLRGPLPKWACLAMLAPASPAARLHFIWEYVFPRPGILRQALGDEDRLPLQRLYGRRIRQLFGMLKP